MAGTGGLNDGISISQRLVELLKKISPVAWQHIHFLGHRLFRDNHQPIDLEAVLGICCKRLQSFW
jgi:hypothetical protein